MLNYDKGRKEEKDWLIEETDFDARYLAKCESIFCQGNGYLGVRNALEEEYVSETRDMFVSGTFNKFHESEVTELPNFPDLSKVVILVNGRPFSLLEGKIHHYERVMNLKNGEVTRIVDWESSYGERIEFCFQRMVSMVQEHVMAAKISIKPITEDIAVKIISGIDGTVTNSGTQHFTDGDKRLYDYTYLEMVSETIQTQITAGIYTTHRFFVDAKTADMELLPIMDRRKILLSASRKIKKSENFVVEKLSYILTARDMEYMEMSREEAAAAVKEKGQSSIRNLYGQGYDVLKKESELAWHQIWKEQDVKIESANAFDQLAMRFAIYHLNIMVKKDDSRVGIGAKALSGEGYKGHSFWDTEVFLLPYYLLAQPDTAKTLLEYRYKNLYGARQKAKEYGYEGAMYPWEAAWTTDGEVTPLFGPADVVTGKPVKYWTGLIEQHITADVAFAVWQYYTATKDEEFMNTCGYEMILDTARFWVSRFEWNAEKGQYEINDIIGPDEYKEHVNNNAYTNYFACYNVKLALKVAEKLQTSAKEIYDRLNKSLNIKKFVKEAKEKLPKVYLPVPDKDTGIIPQFDGYFDLAHIDIRKYKESTEVLTIYKDYSQEQINSFQIAKQGDLVVLMFLLEDLFDEETKRRNYKYYEERTLHDSSLSYSTHSVLASDLGLAKEAYQFYENASKVDLGQEMKSSDAGIHSASMGGIWQAAVMGFGGVRIINDKLQIKPSLPGEWSSLSFPLKWREADFLVEINREYVQIKNKGKQCSILLSGKEIVLEENAEIKENIMQ